MRALLIHNLLSGQRDHRGEIAAAISRISSAGWQLETATCSGIEEVERLSLAAVESGIEAVVVAGGDGSINAAIQSLAHQPTAMGVLPMGTTNVWAREMRIPLDTRAAAQLLLQAETVQVDLGQANGRYFLFVAGVGLDALVTRQMNRKAKRRLGILAYVFGTITEALKLRGEEVAIVADGTATRRRVIMVAASNTRLYGGMLNMAPDAFVDDGLLDVCVFQGRGLLATARHAANTLLGRHRQDPEVTCFQSSTVQIEAKNFLPVQLDGDYVGTTPLTLRVAPRALRVLIPPGPHPQLRQRSDGPR